MGFFEHYFGIESNGERERAVCCPFPHHTTTGMSYKETNPSAHVNLVDRMFHCKVCQQGYGEVAFISNTLECTFGNATRLSKAFNNSEDLEHWKKFTELSAHTIEMAARFGISEKVVRELNLTSEKHELVDDTSEILVFPVLYNDKLIDVRQYNPSARPKIRSRAGAIPGTVIPFDVWKDSTKITFICAGEKDMATTRSHGLNAITLTGGEMSLPFSPTWFKGRHVVIVYDNDDAGKIGAQRLATYLLEYCASVKVCDAFHAICKEDKEDMTDYWNKYNGTREELIKMVDATPIFTQAQSIATSAVPQVTLAAATTPKYIGKLVRSNIQVSAVSDVQYVVPTNIVAEKLKETGEQESMYEGEVKDWELTEKNVQDILHLVDNSFKEDDITRNIKDLLGVLQKEKYVKISKRNKEVVYKASVADMFESMNTDDMPMEYTAYSVGTRLESGKKYTCTYKLVPHPYKGQQLIMIIMNATPANDSVSSFTLTPENKALLDEFRNMTGTTVERMHNLIQKVKGLLGYDGNDQLIELIDLSYHTVLAFDLGQFKAVRGYLDTIIVGESRVGKSSTADALRKTYQLGAFTSLAGNSATIPGLIGGSNKTSSGTMQTKAGLIPQNHKGLIIFEEFSKCNTSIVTELTDIRSSNEVRITRVSGTLTLPAMVRMITLSNVKMASGEIKSIASYPNGIAVITELVPTAEDIARYDLLCVIGDKGTAQIDPFWVPETPLSEAAYQARVRWVWSRTPEQVVINEVVARQITDCANMLNKTYDCHIKVFGTEAWKKLSRLSIAIAGYLVSTDDTYQNIVVKAEHVDYAVDLFIRLYDNPTFRLKEYVANERKYNCIDDEGTAILQQLYIKVPALLVMLEQEAKPSRNSLMSALGLKTDDYNGFMAQLIRGSFVRLVNSDVLPTERFRLGMAKVDRVHASAVAIGDSHA